MKDLKDMTLTVGRMRMVTTNRETVSGHLHQKIGAAVLGGNVGRLSRAQMFMDMARVASRRSTCFRLNVGAIITHENRPVSVGWNGAAAGASHCAGNSCAGVTPGLCPTLHAEANALTHLPPELEYNSELDMYLTDSPCVDCCAKIVGSRHNVVRVFYEKLYRVHDHLEGLSNRTLVDATAPKTITRSMRQHIKLYQVTPAGYVIDHFTREVIELP